MPSTDAVSVSPSDRNLSCRMPGAPSAARNVYRSSGAEQIERFHPGAGLDRYGCPELELLRTGDERGEAAKSVTRQFRAAPVRVVEGHRRAAVAQLVDDEAVAADAVMPMADGARRAGPDRRPPRAAAPKENRSRRRGPVTGSRPSGHLERVENVSKARGEPDAGIARRHAEENRRIGPQRADGVAGAEAAPCCAIRSPEADRPARVSARPLTSPTISAAWVIARANDKPYVSTSFCRSPLVGSPRIPIPMLLTIRTDWTVLAMSNEAKKSVVSRPRPLSFEAFGSFVAKRRPNDGRDMPSETSRTFVPDDQVLDARRRVAGGGHHSSERCGARSVIDSRL